MILISVLSANMTAFLNVPKSPSCLRAKELQQCLKMEQWYRQNKTLIPWALLGLEVAIAVGIRLYKINCSDQDAHVVPSPTKILLPKLSAFEAADLPYPPDAYPNARDVQSPTAAYEYMNGVPKAGKSRAGTWNIEPLRGTRSNCPRARR